MTHISGYESFLEDIKVIKNIKDSTKNIRVNDILVDVMEDPKAPYYRILLSQKLRKLELESELTILGEEDIEALKSNMGFIKKLSNRIKDKEKAILMIKTILNNQKFIKYMASKGPLYCEYCGKGPLKVNKKHSKLNRNKSASCDHKEPISKGGDRFDFSNLVVSCVKCNQHKGNLSYDEWLEKIKK